jgi:Zn-dependent peptidase ImmA (M78 family)
VIQHFENKCKLIGYVIDEFSESIEWPEFKLAALNIDDGYTPQYIAKYNRKLLKLSQDEPVRNIINLLEDNGVIVYELDEIEKFDGVSFITDKGSPVIILNKNFSNDRKRYTLAHELGHILMHNENNFPIPSTRKKEEEANTFASEFLMPEGEIRKSLRSLKMSELAELKSYWLTSMSSIIRRAKDLKCIDDSRYRFFMIEMSRYGYNKKEPLEVFIDKPTCFKNAYNLFKNELYYSTEDIIDFMALPRDIINDIFSFDRIIKLKLIKS